LALALALALGLGLGLACVPGLECPFAAAQAAGASVGTESRPRTVIAAARTLLLGLIGS
jgi:hypothetical protein